jgi:hypothetical protein
VLQLNKRDLPNAESASELVRLYGRGQSGIEAVACDGIGVVETLRAVVMKILAQRGLADVVDVDWDRLSPANQRRAAPPVTSPDPLPSRPPSPAEGAGFLQRLFRFLGG